MPNTPRREENIKAWMPKRQNYQNRNAYRAEVLRKLGKFTMNNKRNELMAALWALPMGNRVWLYQTRNTNPTITAAQRLLAPGKTNLLMWGKKRGGKYQYAHQNFVNALFSNLNYPRLERTARRIQDPKFMTRAYLRRINTPFANNPFNSNLANFRGTVRGNVGNAAKKLLEIREKAARRTIARYVKAGKIGFHISQLRKLRASNRARGIEVSPPNPKKRASSAPPVLTRRR
jgi:hypothetical protein